MHQPTVVVSIRVSIPVADALARRAEFNGVSKNAFIAGAIRQAIDQPHGIFVIRGEKNRDISDLVFLTRFQAEEEAAKMRKTNIFADAHVVEFTEEQLNAEQTEILRRMRVGMTGRTW